MKEKKTVVITLRTTERVKKKLEEEAIEKSWTISQLAEKIISKYIEEKESEKKDGKNM